MPDTGAGLSDRGRPIHGPTPPGQGVPCSRQSPLTGAEVAEVAAIIAGARRGRHAASCRSGCGPGTGTRVGDIVSTGTCTGHLFAAPGDTVRADFGPLGVVEAHFA